jgi:ATP-dependent DNA helicase RecQ
MEQDPVAILKQYWGYDRFRPLQEDIVRHILSGKDTLALLPTGGGKSICFQVPGLLLPGLTLVISPLIALMKDQVSQLRKRGISAAGLFSGMSFREMDIVLDNCLYGQVKFLYLSPERLQTALFQQRVEQLKVSLLAIDEAHCISQWGYDFRPPYLQIAAVREQIPEVPIVALTATATQKVREDIMDKLAFRDRKVFVKSFARPNLSYSTLCEENPKGRLLQMLKKVGGSSIVYVRSRKDTQLIADWLLQQGVKAAAYHAGLTAEERDKRQGDWIANICTVMVATNAFGMGIDKPDVRLVVHLALPESLEAYYQEAGRAGRDEKKAYAVMLYSKSQLQSLAEKVEQAHPPTDVLKAVYGHLGSFLQLAVGSGALVSFPVDIESFAKRYRYTTSQIFIALKKLAECGLLEFNEPKVLKSRITLLVNHTQLYEYQLANPQNGLFVRLLLRMYGGELFSYPVAIEEDQLAAKSSFSKKKVVDILNQLHASAIAEYVPSSDLPVITLLTPRYLPTELPLDETFLKQRKSDHLEKAQAVIHYATLDSLCRTAQLLQYFGELNASDCGVCDTCVRKRKSEQDDVALRAQLLTLIRSNSGITPMNLRTTLGKLLADRAMPILRQLMDDQVVRYNAQGGLETVPNDLR